MKEQDRILFNENETETIIRRENNEKVDELFVTI